MVVLQSDSYKYAYVATRCTECIEKSIKIYRYKKRCQYAFSAPLCRAKENGEWKENISYVDIEELAYNVKVKELYASRIKEMNKQYPPYKTIKYFAVVLNEFSIEGGELTPTLKLKRKVILEKYRGIIEDLYVTNGNGIIAQQTKN